MAQAVKVRVTQHDNHGGGIYDEEVSHYGDNLMFLPVGGPGGADEFGGFAEEGARAGRGDFAAGLAAAHHPAGVGDSARFDRHGGRFAGQRGLVHEQRAVSDLHVRRHDAALAQMEDIAGDEFFGRERDPLAVAPHARLDAQLLPE